MKWVGLSCIHARAQEVRGHEGAMRARETVIPVHANDTEQTQGTGRQTTSENTDRGSQI